MNGEIVKWVPKRTPKLGWGVLTLLEAKTDSANTFLAMGNIEGTKNSLGDVLKILRNRIENEKVDQTLLKTCEYRETKRTRCNKFPTILDKKTGRYLCKSHLTKSRRI